MRKLLASMAKDAMMTWEYDHLLENAEYKEP